jgi:hypothetical protein
VIKVWSDGEQPLDVLGYHRIDDYALWPAAKDGERAMINAAITGTTNDVS